METKQIEKATKIYAKVKAIDADIIALEKMAMLIADGQELNIDLSTALPKDEKKSPVLDADGNLINSGNSETPGMGSGLMEMLMWGTRPVKLEETKHSLSYSISDGLAISVVGTLIKAKYMYREKLLSKIQELTK